MTQATNDPAATLAAIIREVDGSHDLSADALACAILAHPDSQWGPVLPVPTIDYGHLLSPEPGFELLPDDGDPERLPRDAQQVGNQWWGPRLGSDSLAATLGAILERMVDATHPAAPWPEPMKDSSETDGCDLYLSGDLVDDLIKKATRDALMSKAKELALALLKVLQIANGRET